MGVSYRTTLVYGAVIKMKRVPTTVTRYHEITGEPYRKEINEYQYVVGDTDRIFDRDAIPDEMYNDLCDDEKLFLTDGVGYIGIPIASVDPSYSEHIAINPQVIQNAERDFMGLVEDVFMERDRPMMMSLLAHGQLELVGLAY